jgi:hypothetical protein
VDFTGRGRYGEDEGRRTNKTRRGMHLARSFCEENGGIAIVNIKKILSSREAGIGVVEIWK